MYRPLRQRLTLESHEGATVPSSETGTNLKRAAWMAMTRIPGTKAARLHPASSARVQDPSRRRPITAERPRRKSIAHKVCRRFPKRPRTRVSRLLSSPTQRTLIARLKIWKGVRKMYQSFRRWSLPLASVAHAIPLPAARRRTLRNQHLDLPFTSLHRDHQVRNAVEWSSV